MRDMLIARWQLGGEIAFAPHRECPARMTANRQDAENLWTMGKLVEGAGFEPA
jgi:hypothetical protein